jgi:malate dehydrogenase (oxaloacetate-decarboxylating)(NADP+)
MNQWKSAHAVDTKARTLSEAAKGADVIVGLSAKGAFTRDMVKSMSAKPIVAALANPDPEIAPEEVRAVRSDAIICTGRSDYPNQINNVLGFPYIFRGALDARARTINEAMKIAAAEALAALAREDVPDEIDAAYRGRRLRYGPEYIVPVPFDPRLIAAVPSAVAKAAMDSGVARRPIIDEQAYIHELRTRLDPTASSLQMILDRVRANPRRVVFAEGEEPRVIRAAIAFVNGGYGQAILIGREENVERAIKENGLVLPQGIEVLNARLSGHNARYMQFLYKRQQRHGWLQRDAQRAVNNDRNIFAACMVALGDADAMITGTTRRFGVSFEQVTQVIDRRSGERVFGLTIVVTRNRTVFIADTTVHEEPTAVELADIAEAAARRARDMGHEPRVALLSFSNFGNPPSAKTQRLRDAIALLDSRRVDFEYDGEMSADTALDPVLLGLYPFSRLKGPANVLVMPELHSANIAAKLLQKVGGGSSIGPILHGLAKPVQIVPLGATVSDIVNMAALAAAGAEDQ